MIDRDQSEQDFEVQDSERHGGPAESLELQDRGIKRAGTISLRNQEVVNQVDNNQRSLNNTYLEDDDGNAQLLPLHPIVEDGGMFDNPELAESGADVVNPDSIKISLEPPGDQRLGASAAFGTASRSQISRSQMKQSASGFDIGRAEAVGSFFSVERQNQEKKNDKGFKPNFANSSEMSGKKFLDKLIAQQEDRYQKRLPFERGQYHQCIPNPKNENQLLTIQLVKRVLDGKGNESLENHDVFDQDQSHLKAKGGLSSEFMRFDIVPPKKPGDQADENEGEGEDNDDDDNDEVDENSDEKFGDSKSKASNRASERLSAISSRSVLYDGDHKELYQNLADTEQADLIAGVQPALYADIDASASQRLMVRAQMNCEEYAIMATWEIDSKTNRFVCKRFFLIPNPMKRMLINASGTELFQILYTSPHTNDVFFFFKGYAVQGGDDIGDGADGTREFVTQCAFLNLDMGEEQIKDIGDRRSLEFHCKNFVVLKEAGVLQTFINDLNTTKWSQQEMLPSPTVIETPGQNDGKTIVFTAYLREQFYSKEWQNFLDLDGSIKNEVEKCWYPTIFFYNLQRNYTVWEIFGAEQFIQLTRKNVLYLTNDIWRQIEGQAYDDLKQQAELDRKDFSRHTDYFDRVQEVSYGISPSSSEIDERVKIAPELATRVDYRLKFGSNKDLIITEGVRVVEAHVHNAKLNASKEEKRITLIYDYLASFTFALKPAKPLIELSDWLITKGPKNDESKFHTQLEFLRNESKAKGSGAYENGEAFDIEIALRPKHHTVGHDEADISSLWQGYFDTEDGLVDLELENLGFNRRTNEIVQLHSQDSAKPQFQVLEGQFTDDNRAKNRRISFKLLDNQSHSIRRFDGTLNPTYTRMIGKWCFEHSPTEKNAFELNLKDKIEGTLRFIKPNSGGRVEEEFEIQVNFEKRVIQAAPGHEQLIKMEAIEAVDSAHLIYFIKQPDVRFVHNKHTNEAFVQAKLNAISDQDEDSNGTGVVETQVILYNVNQVQQQTHQKNTKFARLMKHKLNLKSKLAAEPTERDYIKFHVNQSFLRTQEKKESQMWYVNPSAITSDGRFIGSIIYEEYGSDEQLLNMVTSRVKQQDQEAKDLDYPQQPVPQSWMVDYPLLAYKTVTPNNKEIAIVHMAQNMPQRIIHLGQWEFVCFVNHTQMVEQKLFDKRKETNCDIMFLVRMREKYRLMSYKSNPWLDFQELPTGTDEDVIKHSLYLFSGSLKFELTTAEGNQDGEQMNDHNIGRRFNNDKVQNVQLITQRLSGVEQYMLIIQFNDCIVQASLNKKIFKVVCQPEAMVRRHLVRGYNEKVYFAETSGNAEKIQQLEFHASKSNEIMKKEIYQLAGTWLVAFEADPNHIVNDINEEVCVQSLYIMDDSQKIYKLKNEDGIRFVVDNLFDFSHHKKLKEVNEMRDNDWAHVHISDRTISFDGTTYNLNSELSLEITVPNKVFGSPKTVGITDLDDDDENKNDDDQDDDDQDNDGEEEPEWVIQSVQAMSMTANMIALAMKGHQDFCFVVKPGPGSRRVNIVGYQQVSELEQMLFVTNTHVLVKFNGGKAVTLLSNGSIVSQPKRIQQHLEDCEIIGESQFSEGKKNVLLEQKYGETKNQLKYICLQFDPDGQGETIGIFDRPFKHVKAELEKLAQNLSQIVGRSAVLETQKTLTQTNNNVGQGITVIANNLMIGSAMQMLGKSQVQDKAKKMRPKFAKEFFVTGGEIIKMCAIVTHDNEIREALEERKRDYEIKRVKKLPFSRTKDHFITILSVPNLAADKGEKSPMTIKIVVFHCLDSETQTKMASDTQYCVVGNYLCHRDRKERVVWVTRLKDESEPCIPVSRLDLVQIDDQDPMQGSFTKYTSNSLQIQRLVQRTDKEHIQMTEVPKAYFTTVKNVNGLDMEYYSNLLQITERNNGMIFDLDTTPIQEVDAIENIDQLQPLDTMVNTGFIMSSSRTGNQELKQYHERTQIYTNEYVNLMFEKRQQRFFDAKTQQPLNKKKFISGMLLRTFAEIDLYELKKVSTAIRSRQKIPEIDKKVIVSIYEGHTIFSIFQDNIDVYEQILTQLELYEFPNEENVFGDDVENGFLRRLHRILTLPTADWKDTMAERDTMINGDDDNEVTNCCKKFAIWIRLKLGMGDGEKIHGNVGFKSIRQKSLHFRSSRFRENLMEISLLTQENSLIDFVKNLDDMQILFTSMSPATVEFFQNAFNTTRFTNKVRNLDWKLGDTLQVFGSKSSTMDQGHAEVILNEGKPKAEESDKIQNRTVNTKMLSLDWVHGSYKGYKEVGFRELIVELANSPHESLFSTELIVTLVEHFWNYYYNRVLVAGFIPYLFYFIATIVYSTNWAVDGIAEEDRWTLSPEFFLRWFILASVFYFMFFEIVSMIRNGTDYLTDIFNVFDWTAFVLNIYTLYSTVYDQLSSDVNSSVTNPSSGRLLHEDPALHGGCPAADVAVEETGVVNPDLHKRRGIAAVLVLLMWVKTFYWMRLFSPTSFYIRLIGETLRDIKYFLILFIFILMTFGNTLLIMNQGRDSDKAVISSIFGVSFIDGIMDQYMLGLGEFSTDQYGEEASDVIIWLVFIATTFITQITFLNMLIAIMGDTFARVSEVKDQSALSEKIKILADYVIIVSRSKLDQDKYLFSISPAHLGTDEQSSWEGTVTQLKKAIDKSMAVQNNNFNKKILGVSTEVSQVNNRLQTLDDRISELASSQQQLPSSAEIERSMRRVMEDVLTANDAAAVGAVIQVSEVDEFI